MMDINEIQAERVRQQQQHMSTRQAAGAQAQHITHRNRHHMRTCPALQVASAPQPATANILPIPEHIHHQVNCPTLHQGDFP